MIQYQQAPDIAPKDGLTFKAVAKYALLPGFIPMLKRVAERFGQFMHMFTLIFGAVGLIDKNHPCLRTENIGRYRFIDILGLASHNVIFDRKHIPQTIMYFAVLLAIVLTISIMLTMALGLLIQIPSAQAQFFSNPVETPVVGDWAYNMLHDLFGKTGLSGIWNGLDNDKIGSIADKAGTQAGINIWAVMLRKMLQTYSMALLVIAVFMVIYLMVVTLIDSAVTGAPFGKEFNSVWAPIRLVMAIGLLVPISQGYNSAQLITFQVAHWGSALGTNVWVSGLRELKDSKFLTATNPDPGYRFIRGLFLMDLCYSTWNAYAKKAGVVSRLATNLGYMEEYISIPDDFTLTRVQFGTDETKSFCGEMTFATPQMEVTLLKQIRGLLNATGAYTLSMESLLEKYRDATPYSGMSDIDKYHASFAKSYAGMMLELREKMKPYIDEIVKEVAIDESCKVADLAAKWKADGKNPMGDWIEIYRKHLGYSESEERFFRISSPSFDWPDLESTADKELKKLITNAQSGGWASAGSFFLIISQTVSKISNGVQGTPKVISMPMVLTTKEVVPSDPRSEPTWWSKNISSMFAANEAEASEKANRALESANSWIKNAPQDYPDFAAKIKYTTVYNQAMTDNQSMTGKQNNADLDSVSGNIPAIYDGWWTIKSGELNPISGLMYKGTSFMSMGLGFYVVGSAVSYFAPTLGDILFLFGSLSLLASVALLIALPSLPFIYFFFAVVEWGMSVFEAIIGMPLWALSFISIKEAGFGNAKHGVHMLFEIMLRPAIIVFALMGTAIIFSAGITLLNVSFAAFDATYQRSTAWAGGLSGLVTSVSSYFVYLFMAYSLGVSCFKLMTSLPGNFMRWFGVSVKGFGDMIEAGVGKANPYIMANAMDKMTSSFGKSAAGLTKSAMGGIGNLGKKAQENLHKEMDGNMGAWKMQPLGGGQGGSNSGGGNPMGGVTGGTPTGGGGSPAGGGAPITGGQNARVGASYPAPNNMGGNIPANAGQGARVGQQYPAPGGTNTTAGSVGGNNANIPPISAPGGGVVPPTSGAGSTLQAGGGQSSSQGAHVGNSYPAPEGYSKSKWITGDMQGGAIKAGDNVGADIALRQEFKDFVSRNDDAFKKFGDDDKGFEQFKDLYGDMPEDKRREFLKKWTKDS